jgi:predicted Zn finger-like uncharacterized protein
LRYLSQCPECRTVYQLSLSQINISDGRVRCAQCSCVFNALSHFILDPQQPAPHQPEHASTLQYCQTTPLATPTKQIVYVDAHLHNLVEGSKLNLYTYLNNLNRINPFPQETVLEILSKPRFAPPPAARRDRARQIPLITKSLHASILIFLISVLILLFKNSI